MKCTTTLKHCKYRLPYSNCSLDSCEYVRSGLFLSSRFCRENTPKPKAKYKVGDTVILTTEREIIQVGQDCDGTVLYGLDNIGFGWSQKQLKLVKVKKEADKDGKE